MDKEIKNEEHANPPAQPQSETPQNNPIVKEINEAKDVTSDAMLEELEETKKTLKQG